MESLSSLLFKFKKGYMFVSNSNRGFCLKFENGYNISVQWGKGNYCSNRDMEEFVPKGSNESATAEVLVFSDDPEKDNLIYFASADNIIGWATSEDVAFMIGILSPKVINMKMVNKLIENHFKNKVV
jgi:hypothetical protein